MCYKKNFRKPVMEEITLNLDLKRKRGRPKKGLSSSSTNTVKWTTEMGQELLRLRLEEFKDAFMDSKEKVAIIKAWHRITTDLSSRFGLNIQPDQAKNKYQQLPKLMS